MIVSIKQCKIKVKKARVQDTNYKDAQGTYGKSTWTQNFNQEIENRKWVKIAEEFFE